MKKIFIAFMAIFFGFSAAFADLSEGVDYAILKNPIPNAKNTVIEVFSYACPFCYKYAKFIPQIAKNLPKNAEFKPFHLKQKGDYGELASQLFASLITKDKEKNIDIFSPDSSFHKAESAYFEAYHKKNNRWGAGKNPDSFLQTGLEASGISNAEFQDLLNNKATQDILKQWEASYEVASIQGVPAFVVNGKYLIFTKNIKSLDDLENKIKILLAK